MAAATSASAAQRLETFGFDKNLAISSLDATPALYFSPHVGEFRVDGTAEIGPSAGVDGNSKKHTFSLDTVLLISGLLPVAPSVTSSSSSTVVQGSGTLAFSVTWNGQAFGILLPDGHYRYDLDATLQRTGIAGSSIVLDNDTVAGSDFIYDATPPSLALGVADGAFLNTLRPPLGATYADALAGIDTASVRLTLDGQDVTAQFTVTAAGAVWNPPADLTEGAHVFTATVADRAGNTTTVSVSFVLDITPPTLSLTPEEGAQLLVQRPDLAGTYSDALSGIDTASVAAAINGDDGIDATARFTVTPSAATWTKDADLAFGDHTLTVSVADRAGNVSTATVNFTIVAPYRYFTLEGDEIRFDVESAYILVRLVSGVAPGWVRSDLIAAGASEIALDADPFGFYEVGVATGTSAAALLAAAASHVDIERAHPVVVWPNGQARGTADGAYVRFVTGTSAAIAEQLLLGAGATSVSTDCCEADTYLAHGDAADATTDFLLADSLRGLPQVLYAAPSLLVRYEEEIGGPLPDGSTATQGYLDQIGIRQSWDVVYGTSEYLVSYTAQPIGLIGTGVQLSHPGLAGRIGNGFSAFGGAADYAGAQHVQNSLGTAMAGVIAANWGYAGLQGVTKDSPLVPAKVREYSCGEISGACFWSVSDAGIKGGAKTALDAGARVLLFDSRFSVYLPQTISYLNAALPAAANGRGAVAVFPMGDDRHEIDMARAPTPLRIANTAFVTAVDAQSNLLLDANVHNRDTSLTNFAAPGSPVLTLDPVGLNGASPGNTAIWQGTPMAAAIYAGSTALSFVINPGLSADGLLNVALDTATQREEDLERSPLFRWLFWILSVLHMQQATELNLCQSSDATPDEGRIHQAGFAPPLKADALPVAVQRIYPTQPAISAVQKVNVTLYKFGGAADEVKTVCGKAQLSGNVFLPLLSVDKRVIFFGGGHDTVRFRAKDRDRVPGDLFSDEHTPYDLLASNALLNVFYWHKPYYFPFPLRQPYSKTATLTLQTSQGAHLHQATSRLNACIRRCFVFFCSTTCSPAVDLLDTPDETLTIGQVAFKQAVLANTELTSEYRAIASRFDLGDPAFAEQILTMEDADLLDGFRKKLSEAIGASVLLDAFGILDDPYDFVGRPLSELVK